MIATIAQADAPLLTFDLFHDIAQILSYDFMRYAFVAGTIVAVTAGVVGYFVVQRASSFAAHALSHVGFTGAAGAVVFGLNAAEGLLIASVLAGIGMGALGQRARGRDVAVGIVLAWALGLGVLFLSLYKGYAAEAYALLFGQILAIAPSNVMLTSVACILTLLTIVAMYRPLVFSSFDAIVAEARGVPVRTIGIVFMALLGLAVAAAAQVVGVLLIFSLLVTPAAIAERITARPSVAIGTSVLLAVLFTWCGLGLGFYLPYPVSFFITTVAFGTYLVVRFTYVPARSSGAVYSANPNDARPQVMLE